MGDTQMNVVSENKGMLFAHVPEVTKRKFKHICEDNRISMQDRVTELMERALTMDDIAEPNMEPASTVLFVRSLPDELKRQFKAWCDLRSLSLAKGLTALMELEIRENK